MKHSWKEYKIGDFLERQYNSVLIDDFLKYKRITIKTKGQGVYLRDEVIGVEIGTKNQFKAQTNQFLLSKIDAMNGAFGIVPVQCDGAIITGNFWTYNINDGIILKDYLELLCVKQIFTEFSIAASEGTTNRKYLREDKFLNLSISLPPLPEQQRIVSKIDGSKNKLDQIKKLRAEQEKEINNLLFSKYTEIIKDAHWLPMKEVAPIIRREVKLIEEQQYPELGIRCFGKGTFHKPALNGVEVGTKKIFQIKEGDLVFSNVFAWEGGIAVAKEEDNDRYGSHRFISCVANRDKALVDFLCFHFLSQKGLEDINACSPGGAGRNKTLGLDKLMKIKVPIPKIELQEEFVALLRKVNTIKQHHTQTNQELSELMPSLLDMAFKGELTYVEQEENIQIAAEPTKNYLTVVKSNIPENKKSFAKQVLGGKIVSLFKDDKYFTRIKFQKLQYIAEHVIEEDLNWNYYRQTAGPYDNKFMHSVIYNLSRNKWFEENDYKFHPLAKAIEIDKYYQTYFGDKNDKLNKLFCLLKNATEKFCEAVATIYAVWNNHIIQKVEFDVEKIRQDFFAWSNRKENLFTNEEFELALQWMQKNSIEPTGFGQVIKEKK
jgi:type I restriction enzyme S subunit